MSQSQPISIVVCDDDAFALRVFASLLKAEGQHQTVMFDNSESCLEYLTEKPSNAEVLFCDLQMPNMDGIELMNRLADQNFSGMIVLVSGEDPRILRGSYTLARSRKLNVLGSLSKPVDRSLLSQLLARAKDERGSLVTISRSAGAVQSVKPEEIMTGFAGGEFIPYFQPKVSLSDKRVMGFEALVRWRHEKRGVLTPAVFLESIEKEQLTDLLLWQVLLGSHGVLEQMRHWRVLGHAFTIAVNLSDPNLLDASLPRRLQQEVKKQGLGPRDLLLEISEKRSSEHRSEFVGNLLRLSLNGFGLSLDDFGTGQATMKDLKDLPLTELKFDRTYVSGIDHDATQQNLLANCVKMAKSLGIRTVAEGVETPQEWAFLQSVGCDLAQGYLVAKPMPAEEVIDWCRLWSVKHGLTKSLLCEIED